VIGIVILVAVFLTIPLLVFTNRARTRRGVRWEGIDWSRGLSEASKLVAEGTRLHQASMFDKALDAFDRAIALEPDLADALLARAVTRHRIGRLDDALADYDRLIGVNGPTCEALNNRGCLHRDRGDLARAVADLEHAIRLAPGFAVAHVSLAEALAERGDWDGALAALRRGIEHDAAWRTHARTGDAFASLREARPDADVFQP
jgi:tetratricopeptide (TPR) repeat protein